MVRLISRSRRNVSGLLAYFYSNPYDTFGINFEELQVSPVGVPAIPDATLPTAALTVDTVLVTEEPGHQFTVVYTDDIEIDASTIDGSELQITGPNAYLENPILVSVALSSDLKTATAIYEAPGPGNTSLWDGMDKYGEYSIASVASKVADASGNFLLAGVLGTFEHLGEITFTTTATNQIGPGLFIAGGTVARWDLGTAANTLGTQIVNSNSFTFTYTGAGPHTITMRARLNRISVMSFRNASLTGPITGNIEDLTALRTLNLSGNSLQMDAAPLLQPSLVSLNLSGNLNQFTGQFNSATAPTGLTTLNLGGSLNQFTGQFDSATAPAGLTTLSLFGPLQQFTGQFDSATTPTGLTFINLSGNLQEFTGQFDSATTPTGLTSLNLSGNLQQFTGQFDSVTAPAGLTSLNLGGNLNQFTGQFDSATAPAGLTTLNLSGALNQFTGQFDSATAPAGLTTLSIFGNLQQLTGQFDSATAPAGLTNLSLFGALQQLTGQFDSATAPAGLTNLNLSGALNQFTGQFDSVTAPAGLTSLNLSGSLQQFTGQFDSVTAPAGLTSLKLFGNLQQFTGQITAAGFNSLDTINIFGTMNLFTGLDFLASKPLTTIHTASNAVTQADIDAAFDAFIADTSLTLTKWTISSMPFAPSGTRVADLAARGVTIIS